MNPELIGTTAAVALSLGLLYALVAAGFTVCYQLLGEANLAFGDTLVLALVLGAVTFNATHSIPLTILVTIVASVLVSLLVDRLVVGPLRATPDLRAPIIATIGTALVVRNIALTPFGADDRSFPPILGQATIVVGKTAVDMTALGAALLLGAGVAGAMFLFRRRWGHALIAIRDDPIGAALVGIPVRKVAAGIYAFAGLVGALGGLLFAAHVRSVGAEVGFRLTVIAFSAAILGGGSIAGAALGGLALGTVAALAQVIVGSTSGDAAALGLLVFTILLAPRGLTRTVATSRV